MNNIILKFKNEIECELEKKLAHSDCEFESVLDAMQYSVSIGGKRIRPCLTMEFASICGGDRRAALDAGCALEMIHTYSLIHDDLPSMDNDDMRRGKPSCHIKFGEATALLAGDALLTLAFQTLAGITSAPSQAVVKCIDILAKNAGAFGMIGGQVIDLESEGKSIELERVVLLNSLKTSCLLSAAAMLGCAISGAEEAKISAAQEFGYNLGIAFQIIDDILDVEGDAAILGKPIGSDSKNDKSTFVSILGLDEAKKRAYEYTDAAISALEIFGESADALRALAKELCSRKM